MSKTILDICLSILSLLITLPFYILIAIAIKIDSKGPIFYIQPRVGLNGKLFNIIKFRTMYIDTNFSSSVTINNDPRITKTGIFLRRYKIDEWPTAFNVLKFQMSFVGPRPESPNYAKLYTEEQKIVLNVKPGITDPAAILFNNESELLNNIDQSQEIYIHQIMPAKLSVNLEYIKNQTLIGDVKIVCNTIWLVMKKIFYR